MGWQILVASTDTAESSGDVSGWLLAGPLIALVGVLIGSWLNGRAMIKAEDKRHENAIKAEQERHRLSLEAEQERHRLSLEAEQERHRLSLQADERRHHLELRTVAREHMFDSVRDAYVNLAAATRALSRFKTGLFAGVDPRGVSHQDLETARGRLDTLLDDFASAADPVTLLGSREVRLATNTLPNLASLYWFKLLAYGEGVKEGDDPEELDDLAEKAVAAGKAMRKGAAELEEAIRQELHAHAQRLEDQDEPNS